MYINKILFASAIIIFGNSLLNAQQKFTINGSIKNVIPNNKIVMMSMAQGRMLFDTSSIVDGHFTLSGNSSEPQKAFIYMTHDGKMPSNISSYDHVAVYLESGNIEINSGDSLKNAIIGGTPLNNDQQALMDVVVPIDKKLNLLEKTLVNYRNNGDTAAYSSGYPNYEKLKAEKDQAVMNFIKSHNKSFVSLMSIRSYFDPYGEPEKTLAAFELLDPSIKESTKQGIVLSRMLNKGTIFGVGSMAPDVIGNTVDNKSISLSSFKGKYVLLDFWASWCAPCRAESPNLVKAYNKFQNDNFTILSFSLDDGQDGKSKWESAFNKDKMNWTQISDLAGWNSSAVMKYNIKAIPANFLIDPTGKIIARDLRGDNLDKKLQDILQHS